MVATPEIALAEQYVNTTNVSLFLTGKAGTGKTTFLRHIVSAARKRCIVVAPTGVAAVNAGGVTIHSFFQLPFDPYLPDVPELKTEYQMPDRHKQLRKEKLRIIRTLELLIIDEISMVRADLLDAVDHTLQKYRRSSRPFGGVQLLMIGDVQQLPPVVTDAERPYLERVYASPFFFHSKALQQLEYITIELTTIFRQQQQQFVDLLNNIRDNRFDKATLDLLNRRFIPDFQPSDSEHYIRLTTHNHQADRINESKLAALSAQSHTFTADVSGNFPDSSFPTSQRLVLKKGAQVMFLRNDVNHRYYNGKIGTVTDFGEHSILVEDSSGEEIAVGVERWENIRYDINPDNNQIEQVVDGTFIQYPLKLAWAVTIHKAQGLTFDRVIVDAHAAFAYGQVYVALSRCRTLEGLVLSTPVTANCRFSNDDVFSFVSRFPDPRMVASQLNDCQTRYFFSLVNELFDMTALQRSFERVNRLFFSHLRSLYPQNAAQLSEIDHQTIPRLIEISERFHRQLQQIALQCQNDTQNDLLLERILKAAVYFRDQLVDISAKAVPLLSVEVGDKNVAKDLDEAAAALTDQMGIQLATLSRVAEKGFAVSTYQQAKVDFRLNSEASNQRGRKRQPGKANLAEVYTSVAHPQLVPMLSLWRKDKCRELDVLPFQVLTQKALLAICDQLPTSIEALARVKGIGKTKTKRYGQEILQIVESYCRRMGLSVDADIVPSTPDESAPNPRLTAATLFVSGTSIEDIAAQVGRAPSTVESYIFQAVEQGLVDAEQVLDYDEMDLLTAYFLDHDEPLKETFFHFNGDFTYLQLRVARHLAKSMK